MYSSKGEAMVKMISHRFSQRRGFSPRNSLEGAEHLLQGLYASLREPLRSMFKVWGRSVDPQGCPKGSGRIEELVLIVIVYIYIYVYVYIYIYITDITLLISRDIQDIFFVPKDIG